MNEQLEQMLLNLDKEELLDIMYQALDMMESYNGHSKTYCIMCALGYAKNDDGEFVKKIN